MTKAGEKLIAAAKELQSVVSGEAMPAKVWAFGWTTWSHRDGLGSFIYADENMARGCSGRGAKIVRVRVETVPSLGAAGEG